MCVAMERSAWRRVAVCLTLSSSLAALLMLVKESCFLERDYLFERFFFFLLLSIHATLAYSEGRPRTRTHAARGKCLVRRST